MIVDSRERGRIIQICPVLLAAAAACGEAAAPPPLEPPVREVWSEAPRWVEEERWRLAPEPRIAIGSADGADAYVLYRLEDARVLDDGTVIAANAGAGELRVYDSTGVHLRTLGGHGGGPGEFAAFSSLRMCPADGGLLLVADGGQDRFHLFSPSSHVRTVRMPAADGGRAPSIIGCTGDGKALGVTYPEGGGLHGEPGSLIRTPMRYVVLNAEGEVESTIADATGRARYVNQVGSVIHYPFVPFAADPLVAGGGGRVYLNLDGAASVRVQHPADAFATAFRWGAPARASVADVWNRYTRESLAEIDDDEQRRRYTRLYSRSLPLPDSVPAVQNLLVDRAGNLWAQRYRLPWDSLNAWDVLDSDGVWLGTVHLPQDFVPLDIGADHVLGRTRDDRDVERLLLFDLVKPVRR